VERPEALARTWYGDHVIVDTSAHRAAPPLSTSVVEAIGGTPLLAIEGIYAKLEYLTRPAP